MVQITAIIKIKQLKLKISGIRRGSIPKTSLNDEDLTLIFWVLTNKLIELEEHNND